MRLRTAIAAALAIFYTAAPAGAWNATGHRVVAAIAYDHLTTKARARVDALIQRHPDYATIFAADAPLDPAARARAAFIAASYWPDLIRGDARFYDETRRDAQATPLLPGFPDMGRHTIWHYYDLPFSPDGTRLGQQRPPHALSELTRLIEVVGKPMDDRANPAYALPWLVHVAGDVHNPLHCTSRFTREVPGGDQGGNLVFVPPGRTLHSLWDGALGTDVSPAYVNGMAVEVAREYPAKAVEKNPKKWIDEGFRLAKAEVYTFGDRSGTREQTIVLPNGYEERASRIARRQAALAGYRIAEVLNRALGR